MLSVAVDQSPLILRTKLQDEPAGRASGLRGGIMPSSPLLGASSGTGEDAAASVTSSSATIGATYACKTVGRRSLLASAVRELRRGGSGAGCDPLELDPPVEYMIWCDVPTSSMLAMALDATGNQ